MTTSILRATVALLLAAACPVGVFGAVEPQPFPFDWTKPTDPLLDLSRLLDAPAGRDGFIRVNGARLVKPDGSRLRFWGINLSGPHCFPDKDLAAQTAADFARFGFNVVRFHHMDAEWGARNIFRPDLDHTRELNAESLDRLDFFVAELKRRGIYTNLNLNVSRQYRAGDGVRDWKQLGAGKSATYFNGRLIELQQEFARQLLTHKNPYTGNEYRHEPAVAVVELVNENSVLEGWANWRLVGDDSRGTDTWSPIPVSYGYELNEHFNRWLLQNVPAGQLAAIRTEAGVGPDDGVPRLMPDAFAKASKERFAAEARFYMELERAFFEDMKRLLRDELGVRSMIVGTADHNDRTSGYPHIAANAVLDYIDGHGYWQHPDIGATTKIRNTPMVNDPLDSTPVQFARTPLAGRPFTISETNEPFPHRYACENFPILTAYALFQDWDGIYWFDWGGGRSVPPGQGVAHSGWFTIGNDPVKLANLVACALVWHRQDVRPAERTVLRSYTPDEVIESLRLDRDQHRPFFTPGFPRSTPLRHATRFALDGSPASPFPPEAPLGRIESDTGELVWSGADRQRGVVTIDTPRTQGLVGFVSGLSTKHLDVPELANEFVLLVLTTLDGRPVAGSATMLLAATAGGVSNTGQRWADDGQTLLEWGRGPTRVEPVAGRLTLRKLDGAKAVRVQPLTAEGARAGDAVGAEQAGDGWSVPVRSVTTWYLIEVTR